MIPKKAKRGLLGSEYVIWFMRFLVIIIVVGTITFMVFAVIRKNYDIRETEAVLISKNIIDCLVKEGKIAIADIDNFGDCVSLDKENSYIEIIVFDSEKELKRSDLGKNELKAFCEMSEKVKQKYPPTCLTQTYLVNINDVANTLAYLKILIALEAEKNE